MLDKITHILAEIKFNRNNKSIQYDNRKNKIG